MTHRGWFVALLLAVALAAPCARAAPPPVPAVERAEAVLEAQRLRGYSSPRAALSRLQAAREPAADAPLQLRRRYHAQVAYLAELAGEPDVASAALAELETLAERNRCAPCRAQWLIARAHVAIGRREGEQAAELLAQARPRVPATDTALRLDLSYAEVFALEARGNLTAAVGKAVDAIKLAERLGSTAVRIRLMIVLVGLNADLGYTDRALEISEDAVALARPLGYDEAMALLRLNQGHIHSLTGQRDKQFEALGAALDISAGRPELASVEVISRSNLADYYLYRGDYQAALAQANSAQALAREIGDRKGLTVALANGGIALSHLGQVDRGVAMLRESIALAGEIDHMGYVAGITRELVKVLEADGRYREALAAMHKAAGIEKEITRQEREKAVMEVQARYEAERKNRRIEQLSAQNRLNAAKVAARTWQQGLWAAVAVALALAAVVLWQWLKRSRESNQRLRAANQDLAEQSALDPLTGAYNRRHCHRMMEQQGRLLGAHSGERDYSACVGLILLDIDHFKPINDRHGHLVGDAVLVEVAKRLQALVREQDAVVRWGGEEFLVVLPGTPPEGLAVLAERLLRTVGARPVRVQDASIEVTISAGCVSVPVLPDQHWEDALHVADQAMYLAKQGGRNRAVCLMAVARDLAPERLADLAAAQAAGLVSLETRNGPSRRATPEPV